MNHWQNKPFVKLILPFILGIWVGELDGTYQVLSLVCLLIGGIIILAKTSTHSRTKSSKGIFIIICTFIYGLVLINLNNQSNHMDHYSQFPNISHVNGTIKSIKTKSRYDNVVLRIDEIKLDSNENWQTASGLLQLYIKQNELKLLPSDCITIFGHPKRITKSKNPYEFDYSSFSSRKHISHSIFIQQEDLINVGRTQYSIKSRAYILQSKLAKELNSFMPFERESKIAQALILGYKDELDNEILKTFQATGAMHILAVSGLHVGIVFMLLNFILSWLPTHNKFYKILKTLLLILGIWSFAYISGLSTAVIRASFMFSLISFGRSIVRQSNIYNTLAFSAFIMLSVDPYLLYDVGFQLSYSALLSIVFFYPKLIVFWQPKMLFVQYLWQISVVSISAQIFTWPLITYYFHQYALGFLISNLIVMPFAFISLALGWIALMVNEITPDWSMFFGQIIQGCLGLMYQMLSTLSGIDSLLVKSIFISKLEFVALITVLSFLILSIIYKSKKLIFAILILISIIHTNQASRKYSNQQKAKVSFYDSRHPIIDFQIGSTIYQFSSDRNTAKKIKRITEGNHNYHSIDTIKTLRSNQVHNFIIEGQEVKFAIQDRLTSKIDSVDILMLLLNKKMDYVEIIRTAQATTMIIKTDSSTLVKIKQQENKFKKNGITLKLIGDQFWSNDLSKLIEHK